MLDHFMSSRNQTWLRGSVLIPFADVYINYLTHNGYSDQCIRTYTHSVAHFAYWMKKENLPLGRVNEKLVDRFLSVHLPVCDCSRRCRRSLFGVRASLKHLLKVLRAGENIPPFTPTTPPSVTDELACYEAYLSEVCGLSKNTQINRLHYAQLFLLHQFGRRPIIMKNVKSRAILRFVAQSSEGFKLSTAQVIASALRSYLRFRAFVGDQTEPLIAAIPRVAQWRLATVPKALSPTDIECLLNSFDRTTPIGRRDYAMARCLIDLGLRAGEVARLQIDDVNWHVGTLRIRGAKGQRVQQLPLPSEMGKSIVDYLRHGRPKTQSRALFVRHRAGTNCPVGSGTVCGRVRLASVRCNINPSIGAHVLRHSVACRMLQAGASLKDIADVLLHRRLDTTMIYAKVDLLQLAQVAAPWPGRSS
jgi:integrase/recombinase XerD